MMWSTLRDIALIGTAKRKNSLKEYWENEGDVSEREFLDHLTRSYFQMQMGQSLPTYQKDISAPGINEEWETIDESMEAAFRSIQETSYPERNDLFALWVSALYEGEQIAAPSIVVDILKEGNKRNRSIKRKIKKIVGQRGAMIINISRVFQYDENESEEIWLEGNTKDRREYLSNLAKLDPQEAVVLLQNTWHKEGLRDKKAFIEILARSLSKEYEEFLITLYDGEFASKPNEKKTEKECRYLISQMLVSLGDNKVHHLAKYGISKLLSNKRKSIIGALSKSRFQKLELEEESEFWNEDALDNNFGLKSVSPDQSIHHTMMHFYLSFFIENVPTTTWTEFMGTTLDDWVDYILYDEAFVVVINKQKQSIYRSQIVNKTLVHKDAGLIQKLLKVDKSNLALLANLKMADYELYVLQNKMHRSQEAIKHTPGRSDLLQWSKSFSLKVLDAAFDSLMNGGQFPTRSYVETLALHLSPDTFQKLNEYHHRASNSSKFNYWDKNLYLPLKNSLLAKQHIFNFKAKHKQS